MADNGRVLKTVVSGVDPVGRGGAKSAPGYPRGRYGKRGRRRDELGSRPVPPSSHHYGGRTSIVIKSLVTIVTMHYAITVFFIIIMGI